MANERQNFFEVRNVEFFKALNDRPDSAFWRHTERIQIYPERLKIWYALWLKYASLNQIYRTFRLVVWQLPNISDWTLQTEHWRPIHFAFLLNYVSSLDGKDLMWKFILISPKFIKRVLISFSFVGQLFRLEKVLKRLSLMPFLF